MPKIILHVRKNLFSIGTRSKFAADLTEFTLKCKNLSITFAMKKMVWIYFYEYDPDQILSGGYVAAQGLNSLEIFSIIGGLGDSDSR